MRVAQTPGRGDDVRSSDGREGKLRVIAQTVHRWAKVPSNVAKVVLEEEGMSREDVNQLLGDLKSPALAIGISSVIADHVTALIVEHRLRWKSSKAEAFTFGKEEARIMVNELLREVCTASTIGHMNLISSLSVLGAFQITNSTGHLPGASVASNNRDIGVRDRGLLCKHACFFVATEIAQDGQELIVGYSMLLKIIQGKYLNTPGQQRARKWVLHPFEQEDNISLEANLTVLVLFMIFHRLRAATGTIDFHGVGKELYER